MFEYLGTPKRVYFGDHEQRIVSIWPKFATWFLRKFAVPNTHTEFQGRVVANCILILDEFPCNSALAVVSAEARKASDFSMSAKIRHPFRLGQFALEKAGDDAALAAHFATKREPDGRLSSEIMDAAISAAASCAGWAADYAALAQAQSTACCPAELMQMLEDARKAGEEEAFRSMISGSAEFA
jgi:hypothetical protein